MQFWVEALYLMNIMLTVNDAQSWEDKFASSEVSIYSILVTLIQPHADLFFGEFVSSEKTLAQMFFPPIRDIWDFIWRLRIFAEIFFLYENWRVLLDLKRDRRRRNFGFLTKAIKEASNRYSVLAELDRLESNIYNITISWEVP